MAQSGTLGAGGRLAPRKAARGPRLAARLVLLGVSTTLSLLALEFAFRVVSPPSPYSALLPLYPNRRMALNLNLRGVSPRGTHSTNSWGLRGEEPPPLTAPRTRILAVGGSTTLCFYLDDWKTWPALLQQQLNAAGTPAWVGNAGLDGHSTRGHLLVMREVAPKLRPQVVLFLTGMNDFGLSLDAEARRRGNPFEEPPGGIERLGRQLVAASRLAQAATTWKRILLDDVHVVRPDAGPPPPLKPLAGPEPALPADPATLLPLLPEYRQNVRTLIRLARADGARPVFLTQPMLYGDAPRWRRVEGSFYWIRAVRPARSAATYWRLLQVYNRALQDVCREEGADCFDLAARLPHDEAYFHDVVHYTERGAELVAAEVAAYLTARPEGLKTPR